VVYARQREVALLFMLGPRSTMVGGAPPTHAAVCMSIWGALAMGLTAGVGALCGLAI